MQKAKPPFFRQLPSEISWLLIALATLLYGFQFVTMNKLGDLAPARSYLTLPNYLREITARQIHFDWLDALLLGGIVALFLALLVLELKKQRLSLFLAHFFASDLKTAALLSISSLVIVRFYFSPGMMGWAGDASQHIVYSEITSRIMAKGEWPIWTNTYGAGSPYLQFYGFLFFYVVGAVDLICRDLFSSLKLVLALSHIASGIGMYFLARTLTRSRRAGFLAGIGYVICFWHTQHVLFMGRLPLSLFYALLPWPFFFFERLCGSPHRLLCTAGGAISAGLLVLTHPGYGFWSTALLALYMAVRLGGRIRDQDLRALLGHSAALLIGGLVFSAYLTLSMWLERDFTGLREGFSLSTPPDPTWRHLLIWSNYRFWLLPLPKATQNWYGGYLGLSLVGIALFGLVSITRSGRRWWNCPQLAGGLCLIFTLLLVFGYRWPLIGSLPGINLLASYRYLLFVTFFMALMVGFGTKTLLILHKKKKWTIAIYPLVLLLVTVDLGPTTLQHPYKSTLTDRDPTGYLLSFFEDFGKEASAYRAKDEFPPYRIFWALRGIHPYLGIGRLPFTTHTSTPLALHPGDLRPAHELVSPLERYLSIVMADLPEADAQIPSIDTYDLISGALGLLDVKYLLATQADGRIRTLTFPDHTPILVSPRISGFSPDKSDTLWKQGEAKKWLQKLLGENQPEVADNVLRFFWNVSTTGADFQRRTCKNIVLADYDSDEDLGTSPVLELVNHQIWDQRVEMQVRISAPCFARLSYAYFPYLYAYVDGEEAKPLQTIDHFIALRLEAGEHTIVLEPHLSPLRRCLLLLDLLLLGATAWIWVRERQPQSPAR